MPWLLEKLVRNDAIKTDPPEIYGWRVYALACSACFGGMLFGIETGIIGGVLILPDFRAKYDLLGTGPEIELKQANLAANIVSTLQAGCFFGALTSSFVADKLGRRPALMIAALIAGLGSLMQAVASGHYPVMYIGRFICGVGVGQASAITPLYVSENAPRAIRGGLTGIYQLFIVTGIMLAFWINYGSRLHLTGQATYIVPLALQCLPSVLLLGSIFLCNETPRFLAKQDRWEEARAVLCQVRHLPSDHPYIQNEFQEIYDAISHERALIGGASFMDLQRETWTIPGNRKRTLIAITLMICQQMTGTNALNYYAPQIFGNLGIKGVTAGLFATGIYGVVKVVSCLIFLLIAADSLGRRRSLLWTSIAQGVCMMYIGLYVRFSPPVATVEGQEIIVPPAGYVSLVAIYLFGAFFQFGWGPVCWIYVSEIPTARLRAQTVSIAAATQWLFNFVVSRSVPVMLKTVGANGYGTYILFSCFTFTMFIFTWFFIPETKGMSLEKMDELFGVSQLPTEKKIEEGDATADSIHSKGPTTTYVEKTAT